MLKNSGKSFWAGERPRSSRIAGGQYTDNLVVFSINEDDGKLTKVHEYTGVDAVTGVLLVGFE